MDFGALAGQQGGADMVMVAGIVMGLWMVMIQARGMSVMVCLGGQRSGTVVGDLDGWGKGQRKQKGHAKRPLDA